MTHHVTMTGNPNTIHCTGAELIRLVARLRAEGKRCASIVVRDVSSYVVTVIDARPEQPELVMEAKP